MSKQVRLAKIALRAGFLVFCGGLLLAAGHAPWRIGLFLIAWWALFAAFDGALERSRSRRNRPLDLSFQIDDVLRFEGRDWRTIGLCLAFVIASFAVVIREAPH